MLKKKERSVNVSGKPKHSLDVNRDASRTKGGRSSATVRRLKMYNTRPKRNSKGHILKHDLKSRELSSTPIQPDCRWFDLPEEILFHHVFSRLPVKSLLRCKSVCEAWNRILCDPQFIRIHLNHTSQQQSHKLLIGFPCNKFYFVDYEEAIARNRNIGNAADADAVKLSFPPSAYCPILHLLGTSNGLVCLAIDHDMFDLGKKILLWNPSTRESKFILDPSPHIHCSHILGFTYDSTLEDYKIVRVIHSRQTCRVDMYTLKNNSWKFIKDAPPNGSEYKLYSNTHPYGFEVNGYIYWLVYTHSKVLSDCLIVGFGLKDENFTVLMFPNDIRKEDSYTDLSVLGGCLAICQLHYRNEFVVWTMKEPEKKKWDRLMTLSTSFPDYKFTWSVRPVCFLKNGKVLLTFYSGRQEEERKFVMYDANKNSIEDLPIYGFNENNSSFMEVTYIESLVSPNMFAGKGDSLLV